MREVNGSSPLSGTKSDLKRTSETPLVLIFLAIF